VPGCIPGGKTTPVASGLDLCGVTGTRPRPGGLVPGRGHFQVSGKQWAARRHPTFGAGRHSRLTTPPFQASAASPSAEASDGADPVEKLEQCRRQGGDVREGGGVQDRGHATGLIVGVDNPGLG